MKYTFRQIMGSLPIKKNSNSSWWVKLWIRKISFLFTFVFINLGFSPNAVSIISIVISIIACVCFMIPSTGMVVTAILLINIWLILDCVDGNIARCKQEKTIYGEFVDDIGGYFTVAFIYLSIGVCAYNYGGFLFSKCNHWLIVFGAASSICDILARLIHKDYVNFTKKNNNNDSDIESYEVIDKHSLNYIRRRVGKEIGISGLFMPLTIVCALFKIYDIMTLFYLVFNATALLSTAIIYIYKADKYDRKHIM